MHQTFHIFLKDVRRLRLPIAASLGLALFLGIVANHPAHMEGFNPRTRTILVLYMQLSTLLPLSWVYLIASAIHEDAVPGDRQFWLSRPYSRWSLLGAKALLVAAFICLPIFALATITLARNGFAVLSNIGNMLWQQALLLLMVALPSAALASITRTISQFILAAIGAFASAMFVGQALSEYRAYVNWIGFDWVTNLAVFATVLCGSAIILPMQYLRRKTREARVAFVAAGLVMFAISVFTPFTAAFAIQRDTAPRRIDPSEVRLELDSSRGRYDPGSGRRGANGAWIAIPVKLHRAADAAVEAHRIEVTVRGVGMSWSNPSRWEMPELRSSPGEPEYRLYFAMDWNAYETLRKGADVVVTGHFNVYGEKSSHRAPLADTEVEVPGAGICRTSPSSMRGTLASLACRTPFSHSFRTMARLEQPGGGLATAEHGVGRAKLGWVPHTSPLHPVSFAHTQFAAKDSRDRDLPAGFLNTAELVVDNWRLQGHIRTESVLSGVRLEDYEILPK